MLFYYLAYKTMEFLHGRVFIVFFYFMENAACGRTKAAAQMPHEPNFIGSKSMSESQILNSNKERILNGF